MVESDVHSLVYPNSTIQFIPQLNHDIKKIMYI